MSERLPRITAEQLLRALRRDGWFVRDQVGSHIHLRHLIKRTKLTVPSHRGVIIKPKVLQTVLDLAELTADDLLRLL